MRLFPSGSRFSRTAPSSAFINSYNVVTSQMSPHSPRAANNVIFHKVGPARFWASWSSFDFLNPISEGSCPVDVNRTICMADIPNFQRLDPCVSIPDSRTSTNIGTSEVFSHLYERCHSEYRLLYSSLCETDRVFILPS